MPQLMLDRSGAVTAKPNSGGQEAFASDWRNIRIAVEGGWMCVAGDTIISGTGRCAADLAEYPWPLAIPTMSGFRYATAPWPKMRCKLLTLGMSDGRHVTVAEGHRFRSDGAWRRADGLTPGQRLILLCAPRGASLEYGQSRGGQLVRRVDIATIKSAGYGWVFDLHVPGVHHYFANGLLSHNSGKTWIGARKLVTLHVMNAFDAEGRATHVPSAVVAPTYRNALDYDLPELISAFEDAGLRPVYKAGDQALIIPELGTRKNPSLVMIRSAERPDRIAGWQVGAGWGDEATRWPENRLDPRRDAYLQFQSRVRHPRARLCQLFLTYTNEGDATRMFDEFHPLRPGHALYRLPTLENPLAKAFYNQQIGILNEQLAKQYLDGEAVNFRGKTAYDSFCEARNVDASLMLRKDLPLHVGIDFNIQPGMHVEVGQYDTAADMLTVTHEIHGHRMNLRESIRALQVLIADLGGWQWPQLQIFGDATGTSEWAGTGESCYEIMREAVNDMGVPYRVRVPKTNPLQADRINAMNIAFLDLRGRVHWKCHPRCTLLIRDLHAVKTDEHGELDKKNSDLTHACLAAGTMIETLEGEVPIELVRPGMRVLTRRGYRDVLWSGCTGRGVDVLEINTSWGRGVIGTGDHKVLRKGIGFTPLGVLEYGNELYPITPEEIERWHLSELSMLVRRITWAKGGCTFLLRGESGCMSRCGSITMGRSLSGVTSITETDVQRTMRLKILSASRRKNTSESMLLARQKRQMPRSEPLFH